MELSKLKKVANFAMSKGVSRQWIETQVKLGKLTLVVIDTVNFIYMDEKAEKFKKKGE